jgi:pectin methylesterase-like acyl-CoA thioesterase
MAFSYDVYGNDTLAWKPPTTERDGLWQTSGSGGGSGFQGEIPLNLKADVTVCKGGGKDCYKTVQEAVNAAPDNGVGGKRFVIYIKEGIYEETVRVPLEKRNVVFLGDGIGKTVITGSANVGQPGMTTYNSATVAVLGDGFMAKDLTIENTAGPDAHQAVAFRLDSDLSVIENCEFLGNQDTLYAHSLRQFYKSCRIEGNVDFIFGNSAAVFQDCQILVRPRQLKPEHGENNAVTAHGRTDPAQTTGFVFQNCLINGTEDYMALYHSKPKVHKNYLGRPWKEYSRTVFINSILEELITPQGWMPWNGDFALKTLYYGEFENSGAGSDLSQRVSWSSKIPAEHVVSYSVENFIQGGEFSSSHSSDHRRRSHQSTKRRHQ